MSILKKVSGIVAEFNPFHNGHMHLIQSAKAVSDGVVCVMSGSFVQRGEPALLSKSVRTTAALNCGADMVIELPAPYSVATAQNFALAGVSLLKCTSVVNTLVFGSECADAALLKKASKWETLPDIKNRLDLYLKEGCTFAKARESAVREVDGNMADVLSHPNDILAIEYISAAEKIGFNAEFVPIKRVGTDHDSLCVTENFASASNLRRDFENFSFEKFVPPTCLELYKQAVKQGNFTSYERFGISAGAILRNLEKDAFSKLPDISEGLDNVLFRAVSNASSFEDAAKNAKTKRYTLARIRRLLCLAALQVDKDTATNPPPYIKVLGISEKGEELLKQMAKNSALPLITRPSDIKQLNAKGLMVIDAETKATDLAAYCRQNPAIKGSDYTDKFIKV